MESDSGTAHIRNANSARRKRRVKRCSPKNTIDDPIIGEGLRSTVTLR
jgi:hypothetical protein